MREIEFRGKRVDTKEWVYGQFLKAEHTPSETHSVIATSVTFCWGYFVNIEERYEVIPETVGQFIGVMAKNQKEVYEDDIVKWGYRYHENPIRIAIVKLNPDIQLICLNMQGWDGMPAKFDWGNFAYSDIFAEDGEVIGNIHDNPELMK